MPPPSPRQLQSSHPLEATCPSFPDESADSDGIFKLLKEPGIDSTESIPPVYVAWRAGTTTLFLLAVLGY